MVVTDGGALERSGVALSELILNSECDAHGLDLIFEANRPRSPSLDAFRERDELIDVSFVGNA